METCLSAEIISFIVARWRCETLSDAVQLSFKPSSNRLDRKKAEQVVAPDSKHGRSRQELTTLVKLTQYSDQERSRVTATQAAIVQQHPHSLQHRYKR